MIFDVTEYYSGTFTAPLGISIMFSILLISIIVIIMRLPSEKKKLTIHNAFIVLVPSLLIICMLFQLKYGIPLANETEDNVITITGEIQSIDYVFLSPRYYYNDKPVHASIIKIDNKELYFMTKGNLEIGDNIRVEYLPKSLFVLKVEILNNN